MGRLPDGLGDCRDFHPDCFRSEQQSIGTGVLCVGRFRAAFGPIVILSVLWKRITAYGALSGMVAGALTVVVWAEWVKNLICGERLADDKIVTSPFYCLL